MDDSPAAARALEARIRNEIPLARAMDLGIVAWDGSALVMAAPLAPNINDKGCAFGGSLTSLMTIAGWARLVLGLEAHHISCDVFVGRSEVVYRAPVWADFRAHAVLADASDWDAFMTTLAKRGKARIGLACHITTAGSDDVCATLDASFVAMRHAPDAATHVPHASQ